MSLIKNTTSNVSGYIDSLNNFLYKFLFFNFIINIFLYYYPNVDLASIIYIVIEILFFVTIFKIYKKFTPILFSQILVMFLVNLTYLTYIISYIVNNFIFNVNMDYIFKYEFYCNAETYFLANSYLFLFGLSVIFFNRLVPRSLLLIAIEKIHLVKLNTKRKNIFIFISSCIFFELFFYLTGIFGTQASGGWLLQNSEEDVSTWYTQFFSFVMIFHLVLNILFLQSYEKKHITIFVLLFLIVSFLFNFAFFCFFARKDILIFFLINFIVYFILVDEKIISLKMFFVYLFSFIIIFQSWTFLSTIRSLELVGEKMSLREMIKERTIFLFFTDQDIKKYGKAETVVNMSTRVFNNQDLASIFYYNSDTENRYLYGQLIFSDIIHAVPQIIYSKKNDHKTGEALISTVTDSPLYYSDTLQSLQTSSYVDFGLFGLFIYPIIINFLLFIVYKIIALRQLSNISVIYILALVMPVVTLRSIEINPTEWFVLVRNILIFILIFNFLFSFTQKKEIVKS